MKNKIWLLTVLLIFFMSSTTCKKNVEQKEDAAIISFLKGNAKVIYKGKETKAKQNDVLKQSAKIVMAKNSIAILKFQEGSANMELQEGASLVIQSYSKLKKVLYLEKGNAWTKFKKSSSSFTLKTPTTVAAVRGTKFFTFQFDDITGICFCEGKVKYKASTSGFNKINEEDYVVFNRNKKSITITRAEMEAVGMKHLGHNHSKLANSPLGPEEKLSKQDKKKFLKLINEKFAAAK